jgi:rfaE bifunctional protein kinase chain/domain
MTIYSSSKFINAFPPNLQMEKLSILMGAEGISFNDLRDAISKFTKYRVHIIGDTIVDSYTNASMIGGQTKTPTMSVLYEGQDDYIGGAAIVAKHMSAAGADVVFSTVLGDDNFKDLVLKDLEEAKVDCYAIIDPTRPTTNKNAIVVGGYRLLKIDTLDNSSISDSILHDLAGKISNVRADAVIFSDFRHGIFNRRTIPELAAAIKPGIYKVADSQVASRWGNITEFQNFDLITPNEREARFSLADQDSGIRSLAARLYDSAKCKTLLLKLGAKGILTCKNGEHNSNDSFFVLDSFVDNLVDAVGSGDALLAYSTLTMLATKSEAMATIIGSIAAACECEVDGNIPITPDLVLRKINAVEQKLHYKQNVEVMA